MTVWQQLAKQVSLINKTADFELGTEKSAAELHYNLRIQSWIWIGIGSIYGLDGMAVTPFFKNQASNHCSTVDAVSFKL